jgi:TPP-dependent indolepyruvate ferredoxin oxidoreductase alpha subunit
MASSQNEQDNRHYAVAAGLPMLEPSDSQEAYDFTPPPSRFPNAGKSRCCCA